MPGKRKRPLLDKYYYDIQQPTAFGGLEPLAKVSKKPLRKVKHWAEKQLAYTLHKPVRLHFKRNPILVSAIDEIWQADLADLSNLSKENRGYKYLLTVIDIFSKFAFTVALKNKSATSVKKAFEDIFAQGRKPQKIHTDKGGEFLGKQIQDYFKKEGIHHYVTQSQTKAFCVERYNRTLKTRMFRAFTAKNTLNYVDMLQDLVDGYNHSKHRTIGMPPANVTLKNEREVWDKVWKPLWIQDNNKKPRYVFNVGDFVRISKTRRTFKKSYLPGWTEEVFIIKYRIPKDVPVYKITEYDGTPIKGTFYAQELQRVNVADNVFRVDRVLKRRGKGKNAEVLVSFKGWPSKYNEWLPARNIKNLK